MHVLFQEIGAFVASMAIKDSEIAATWPSAFEIGFGDVHDDGDSILIVVLDEAMIGVDCIAFDCAVRSLDEFDWLYFYGVGEDPFLFL